MPRRLAAYAGHFAARAVADKRHPLQPGLLTQHRHGGLRVLDHRGQRGARGVALAVTAPPEIEAQAMKALLCRTPRHLREHLVRPDAVTRPPVQEHQPAGPCRRLVRGVQHTQHTLSLTVEVEVSLH